ncbi:MAG: hypothetical protein NVSMB23_22790 [Myxococcales bacterium]
MGINRQDRDLANDRRTGSQDLRRRPQTGRLTFPSREIYKRANFVPGAREGITGKPVKNRRGPATVSGKKFSRSRHSAARPGKAERTAKA